MGSKAENDADFGKKPILFLSFERYRHARVALGRKMPRMLGSHSYRRTAGPRISQLID